MSLSINCQTYKWAIFFVWPSQALRWQQPSCHLPTTAQETPSKNHLAEPNQPTEPWEIILKRYISHYVFGWFITAEINNQNSVQPERGCQYSWMFSHLSLHHSFLLIWTFTPRHLPLPLQQRISWYRLEFSLQKRQGEEDCLEGLCGFKGCKSLRNPRAGITPASGWGWETAGEQNSRKCQVFLFPCWHPPFTPKILAKCPFRFLSTQPSDVCLSRLFTSPDASHQCLHHLHFIFSLHYKSCCSTTAPCSWHTLPPLQGPYSMWWPLKTQFGHFSFSLMSQAKFLKARTDGPPLGPSVYLWSDQHSESHTWLWGGS